jgi:hypothetical protein
MMEKATPLARTKRTAVSPMSCRSVSGSRKLG